MSSKKRTRQTADDDLAPEADTKVQKKAEGGPKKTAAKGKKTAAKSGSAAALTTSFVPYLRCPGNAKEAIEFYHSVFGGETKILPFGEGMGPTDKVMHAELKGPHVNLFFSDPPTCKENPANHPVVLCLGGNDADLLNSWWNKLADGGKIGMELKEQFWGATYGDLVDRFGFHWMFNIEKKPE